MKRVILILAILMVPATLIAQEQDPSLVATEPGTASSLTSAAHLTAYSGGVTAAPNLTADVASPAVEPGSAAAPSQVGKPPQQRKPEKPSRPPIEGSMVGYIDNAIIGSQVRLRFDAAFDDNEPDRAEFFYGKCGCYRGLPGTGNDPSAPGPPPGSGIVVPTSLNFQQLYILGEYAPVRRFSVFAEVPVRWIQAQGLITPPANGPFPNEGGLSDVQAGFKLALLASSDHYVTIKFEAFFPTGDSLKGLGTNHYSVQPELLYYQRLSDRWSVETQLGDWHPIGGSAGVPTTSSQGFAGDVFFYGVGPSYQLYRGERVRVAPVVELVGWSVLSGFETVPPTGIDASGTNIVNMKVGFRTSIGAHNSFYVGFGHSLTHEIWYKEIARAEYRYSF